MTRFYLINLTWFIYSKNKNKFHPFENFTKKFSRMEKELRILWKKKYNRWKKNKLTISVYYFRDINDSLTPIQLALSYLTHIFINKILYINKIIIYVSIKWLLKMNSGIKIKGSTTHNWHH